MRVVYTVLNGDLAGGQVICGRIMLAARDVGHQVLLVTPSLGHMTDWMKRESVPIVQLPMARTFHFHRALQFAKCLRDWRADLVHCHSAVSGTILVRLGAKLAGVPMISHVHGENKFSGLPWIRSAQVWFDNFTSRFADEIVAISEDTRRGLITQGIPARKVRVILNGVIVRGDANGKVVGRARAELGIRGAGPVVGMVARLCQVKGQREFILAAQHVRNEFPDATFAIIGEDQETHGDFLRELERLAVEMGIDTCVHFSGFHPDAARLMHAFDLFVLPSWIEGLPVTILEAMAAGKPVVATSVGGVPELVVEGETGLLVPPRDPERLAQAILHLLQQPDVARRMGTTGYERVRQYFSQSEMFEQVNKLYEAYAPK